MNRFTFADDDGRRIVSEVDILEIDDYYGGDAIERLSAYEDTTRTPEEVAALSSMFNFIVEESKSVEEEITLLNRSRELYKADKDGRVLILPCKPGNHIFAVGPHKIMECKVSAIYQGARDPVACVEFGCDSDCNGCPFYAPLSDPEGDFRCRGEWGEAEINFAKFGKTVFLTREEAEKAMAEMKGDTEK